MRSTVEKIYEMIEVAMADVNNGTATRSDVDVKFVKLRKHCIYIHLCYK